MKKIYILLPGLIFSCVLSAQCPKFCFFEEFTQASCSPCALGNSFFEPNILAPNPVKVRLVAYHTWWPGVDPMYSHNPTGNNARTNFYNVSGVPQMHLCGIRRVTGPASFTQRDVDNIWNEGSPLKISLTEVDNGNNRDVTITVKTIGTQPSGSYTLYCAVIQRDTTYTTPPGANGETFFPCVFRQMLPGNNGVPITIPATGNSVTFGPYNYLEDASFWVNPNKIGVVAFIQDNLTKEVIQSGSTFDPPINSMMTSPLPDIKNAAAFSPQTFSFSTGNSGASSEQFSYALTSVAPLGWASNFTINSNTYTAPVTLTIPAGATYPVIINVTASNNPGVGKYTLTMTSVTNPSTPPMRINMYVISGVTDLVVNNSNVIMDESIPGDANNWSSVYTSALSAAGCTTLGNLDDHNMLIHAFQQSAVTGIRNIYYNVGYSYLSIPFWADSLLIPQLTSFLNGGGRLFIAGQYVANIMDAQFGSTASHAFMNNMLGAHYTAWGYDATLSRVLTPKVSDQVFGVVPSDSIINYYGMNPQGWANYMPMICHDTLLGKSIFYYNWDTTKTAGVRTTNGTWKTVFLSPGVEMLRSTPVKNQILALSYYWFNGTLSTQEFDVAMMNIGLGQNYPNPAASSVIIPLSNIGHDMRLQVLDLQGRILLEQAVGKGSENVNVQVSSLGEGIYFYRLADGNNITPSKLM